MVVVEEVAVVRARVVEWFRRRAMLCEAPCPLSSQARGAGTAVWGVWGASRARSCARAPWRLIHPACGAEMIDVWTTVSTVLGAPIRWPAETGRSSINATD